jgi:hypothetical protein
VFINPRTAFLIVTSVAIGVAVAIKLTSRKRKPAVAPEQPRVVPLETAIRLESATIEDPALPVKPAKPRVVRTNSSEYVLADGWFIRSNAYRQQRLRKISDAMFEAS